MNDVVLGMPPSGLRGKAAIVTGVSRHQSIGAAICRTFAACGVDLLFTHWLTYDLDQQYDTDEAAIVALADEFRSYGVRVASIEIDLGHPDSAKHVMDRAADLLGTPSILVNNAAYWSGGGIDRLDAEQLDRHLAVNVRGMALLCAEFVRRYPGGPGGRIINLSSGQGVAPMPNELAYATSKGAIEAFTSCLAPSVAARGITVNAVDPGATDTGWIDHEQRRTWAAGMGMGRVGQPDDAARIIAFLASEAGRWITGQIIHSRGA